MSFVPIIVPVDVGRNNENVSVDFFCKTAENKTVKQQQYCTEYFASEEVDAGIEASLLFWVLLTTVFMAVGLSTDVEAWYTSLGWVFGVPVICAIIFHWVW